MYRSLLDPILEISGCMFSQGVRAQDVNEYNDLLLEMEKLREKTRAHWSLKLGEIINATRRMHGEDVQIRRSGPLSRCIRVKHIHLELERCLSMFENIPIEDFLKLNRRIEKQVQDTLDGG